MDDLRAEVQRISEELEVIKSTSSLAIERIDNYDKTLTYPPTEQDMLVVKSIIGETSSGYIWGDIAATGVPYTITSGVTVTKTGTGSYRINHSIGKTVCIILPIAPPSEGHLMYPYVVSYNSNIIDIILYRSGTAVDYGFYFIAFPQT